MSSGTLITVGKIKEGKHTKKKSSRHKFDHTQRSRTAVDNKTDNINDMRKFYQFEKENPYNVNSGSLSEIVNMKLNMKYNKLGDSYVHTTDSNQDIMRKNQRSHQQIPSHTQVPFKNWNDNIIDHTQIVKEQSRNINTEFGDTNDEIPLHLVQSKSGSTTSKNSTRFNLIIE
jgi:hypothetical protein